MPCDCELDLEHRCVRARGWGVLTFEEALATRHKFLSDPAFEPDFDQIYDGTAITRLPFTAAQVAELARADMFNERSRRAFVAPQSDTSGAVRLYQSYRKVNGGREKIRVFRTLAAAEAWLAGEHPPIAPRT